MKFLVKCICRKVKLYLFFIETLNKLLGFCNQYGEAVKIYGNGETVVILNSPETINAMCKSTSYDHIVKAPVVYDLMKPFISNGVLVSRGTCSILSF